MPAAMPLAMVMITCEKCFYPLSGDQVRCPECDHPASLSSEAFVQRGAPVSEEQLRAIKVRALTLVLMLIAVVMIFTARMANELFQSKVLFLSSWWLLCGLLVAIGMVLPFLLGARGLLPKFVGAGFLAVAVVLMWQGPAVPRMSSSQAMLTSICGALVVIAIGASLLHLRNLFMRFRIRPISHRSAWSLVALGGISALAVFLEAPTTQASHGMVVVAGVTATAILLRELARLLLRVRGAIPVAPVG